VVPLRVRGLQFPGEDDALRDRGGSATTALEVPSAGPDRLRAGSLVVVRAAEKLAEGERTASQPLRYGDVVLYPNLGRPIAKAPGRELAFFLTVWPAEGRPGSMPGSRCFRRDRPWPPRHCSGSAPRRMDAFDS
jgi:hypothetical protein